MGLLCRELCCSCYQAMICGELAFFYCLSKCAYFFSHYFSPGLPAYIQQLLQIKTQNMMHPKSFLCLHQGLWILMFELLVGQHTASAHKCSFKKFRNHVTHFYLFLYGDSILNSGVMHVSFFLRIQKEYRWIYSSI